MERRGEITPRRDTEKERACVCIRPDVSNTMVTCSLPVNDQFIVLDVVSGNRKSSVSRHSVGLLG